MIFGLRATTLTSFSRRPLYRLVLDHTIVAVGFAPYFRSPNANHCLHNLDQRDHGCHWTYRGAREEFIQVGILHLRMRCLPLCRLDCEPLVFDPDEVDANGH